jgi:hypothetical protein
MFCEQIVIQVRYKDVVVCYARVCWSSTRERLWRTVLDDLQVVGARTAIEPVFCAARTDWPSLV